MSSVAAMLVAHSAFAESGKSSVSPTYSPKDIRSFSFFGAHVSMRLEAAQQALAQRGFKRDAFAPSESNDPKARVLESAYYHPTRNTYVSLNYARLPNGERRVSSISLWEEVPLMKESAFGQFVSSRYGKPTNTFEFQGHPTRVWSQQSVPYEDLLLSTQCMMECVPETMVKDCQSRSISGQVYMEGGFNTNMLPGKLYWTAQVEDLGLQRSVMLQDGAYPKTRRSCPKPVI